MKNFQSLCGELVILRAVNMSDCAFITHLRNENKAKFLGGAPQNEEMQKRWMEEYFERDNDYYFVITRRENNERLGLIRAYNFNKNEYEHGSWIMSAQAKMQETIEGDFLLKKFVFCELGMEVANFVVRPANVRVWRFIKQCGGEIWRENDEFFYLKLKKNDFLSNAPKILRLASLSIENYFKKE